jgi:dynein heavy chain, axonemal
MADGSASGGEEGGAAAAPLTGVGWLKARVSLARFVPELWAEAHEATAQRFLEDRRARRLTAFVRKARAGEGSEGAAAAAGKDELVLEVDGTAVDFGDAQTFAYFTRGAAAIGAGEEGKEIQWGTSCVGKGGAMGSLSRVMSGVFLPQVLRAKNWPQSARKEFTGLMHKFMAALTETSNQALGKTVLYVPRLGEHPAAAAAAGGAGEAVAEEIARDKELVQQLESTVIHWTRQIKEVVNNQDNGGATDKSAGPLSEIRFWRERTLDLNGISEQLQQPGVAMVVAVLELSKSSYLPPFHTLAASIARGSVEANDNLSFLGVLQGPCEALAIADPKEDAAVEGLLRDLLCRIRFIWTNSSFYNTSERVTGLLRKISNELIAAMRRRIDLPAIFAHSVAEPMEVLRACIGSIEMWRTIYTETVTTIATSEPHADRHWAFDISAIFAQIDAFKQRCRDLQEVCEGLLQFSRGAAGGAGGCAAFPTFGGLRGPDVVKSLNDIEDRFRAQIARLAGLGYPILHVGGTGRWHGDFNKYRAAVKDLEVMLANVINGAFETAKDVPDAVLLLEAFTALAKKDHILRCVEKHTSEQYDEFAERLADLNKYFEDHNNAPPLTTHEPSFAGAALWAKGMRRRVSSHWTILENATFLQQSTAQFKGAKTSAEAFMNSLDKYQHAQHVKWTQQVEELCSQPGSGGSLMSRLDIPLMARVGAPVGSAKATGSRAKGELVCNFDQPLLTLFSEVAHWEKVGGNFPIPYPALDICNQKEKLRVLRESVMLVVRSYNAILRALTATERRLFNDHIRKLDKRINQGCAKLTWSSKGIQEWYVKENLKSCDTVQEVVSAFKSGREEISRACRVVASTPLLKIEKNYIYDDGIFERKQEEYRTGVVARLKESHAAIVRKMAHMYGHFTDNAPDVQREWRAFVNTMDGEVEVALRATVKKSLQELARAINGDKKQEPQPLFQIHAVLETSRVEYKPNMITLTQSVNVVSKEVIGAVAALPRLGDALLAVMTEQLAAAKAAAGKAGGDADEAAASQARAQSAMSVMSSLGGPESFFEVISNDDDTLKILVQVMNGMSASATELQKYLSYWDKYKPIWEMDKDAFMRRYAKQNRPLVQYDIDITRYREFQYEISQEDVHNTINFIKIGCQELKQSLVQHTLQWQDKLARLLNQNAKRALQAVHAQFAEATRVLNETPKDLTHLNANINLLRQRQEDIPNVRPQFEPIRAQYELLAKFDVAASEEEMAWLGSLDSEMDVYESMLGDSEKALSKCKVNMKRDLEQGLDSFKTLVVDLRKGALETMPYSGDLPIEEANRIIAEMEKEVASARAREAGLQDGLEVFAMTSPDPEELKDMEKDIKLLKRMWGATAEWETTWDCWKNGRFSDLEVDAMELEAGKYNKTLVQLGREIKSWSVWQALNNKIAQFRQTMPLIMDLRNPTIRPRHWENLMSEISRSFDPNGPDFTLEKVFDLGLVQFADYIGEMSANSNKEYSIEQAMLQIEERWGGIDIDIVEYKDVYFKVRSTEDLFTFLEDDQVAVSTMKASKFYPVFKELLDTWDHNLSHASEVVEVMLTVQRQWMYLESIFMSSEDIRKQLPQESVLFDEVNSGWKIAMGRVFQDANCQRACHFPKMLETVTEMDGKLDRIQKALDAYLETKRMIFPRFYFLSNDDLLEILGQQKEPANVQRHIKKCFEGIMSMHLVMPQKGEKKEVMGEGMTSPDGEKVTWNEQVTIAGAVELWLVAVERMMQFTMAKIMPMCVAAFKGKKEKWIHDWQGQALITCGQIIWTTNCNKALQDSMKGKKNMLKGEKKRQVSYINRLSDMVRGDLSKLDRRKLVALLTMEIHSRDTIDMMAKAGCNSTNSFDWLQQLRLVYVADGTTNNKCGGFGEVWVKQVNCTLEYSYEYQGNNGRLVITPLTDRCVLTLNTAMFLNRGGNPLGPAGTGKTETVKDLGKSLAKYVVVFNCSDGLDYKSVGRMFCGLVQAGAWGCFDEFNRIDIEVLSVVAMQILVIVRAIGELRANGEPEHFDFLGQIIKCDPNAGIFITMNPGYAGRTELPDNLKALMRPVAMMTPDLALIAEVMLAAEGFRDSKILAKKTITLYTLMIQQLSKQDHYDYGLRNLKAVLNCAGALKRADPDMAEDAILMRALRDMNVPKFIADDLRLFKLLLSDLFPTLELPASEAGGLITAIEDAFKAHHFQLVEFQLDKVIQLYDSMLTRHSNMTVGATLGGKTRVSTMLMEAKTKLAAKGDEPGAGLGGTNEWLPVTQFVFNAKSITLNELFGAYDLQTFEWMDGILSTYFKRLAESNRPEEKWIMFDGPVDTTWIESMNSTMDDNKTLTLINGDRILMSATMTLLFEVLDLSVASPATVSRAGMIYIDAELLGWECVMQSWIEAHFEDEDQECWDFYKGLFDKYVPRLLEEKAHRCREGVPIADINAVQSLCTLFECVGTVENGLDKEADAAGYWVYAEKIFVFCTVWSVCAAVDEAGRVTLDNVLRDIEAQFPPMHTIYDYYLDPAKKDWEPWESVIPAFHYVETMPFYKMIVPTIDTTRNAFVINMLIKKHKHTLVTGESGTGKTVACAAQLDLLPSTHTALVLNFSAATDAGAMQLIVEGVLEKRSKDKMGPSGGKKMVMYIDDFNMPTKDAFGSQPPLELLRLWMDHGGWYDREKCVWRYILDTMTLVSMAPPSGGREVISERTQSRYNLLNMTFPADAMVSRIFESILAPKLATFDDEIKSLAGPVCGATLALYHEVTERFLPTPEKAHYLFNLREVSKVIQGCFHVSRGSFDTADSYKRLWAHESMRVFADRFLTDRFDDPKRFREVLDGVLKSKLDSDYDALMGDCASTEYGAFFCSFLGEPDAHGHAPYEECKDMGKLKMFCEEKLEDYNSEPKLLAMDLVLFRDALGHICRIHRVLMEPRGNMMLVGVGGSGRQSLARLATYMAEYECFTIEITKQYRMIEFREDLKRLFSMAGGEGKHVAFLFNDTQVKEEAFVEDINSILSAGEVPNLYGNDERIEIFDLLAADAKKDGIEETPGAQWHYFVERCRINLHVVLAMSPVGEAFRTRCRMYPALVSGTTIDWFQQWPADALTEVAVRYLEKVETVEEGVKVAIATVFAHVHLSVSDISERMLRTLKRHNYVTPTNYLELVKGYRVVLAEKVNEVGSQVNKLKNGLAKLTDAKQQVAEMSEILAVKKVTVAQSQKDCEELLVVIVSERRTADEQQKHVEAESAKISVEAKETAAIASDAQRDLDVALPALQNAMAEVDKLDKSSISEVKAYTTPPAKVQLCLEAVMILFRLKTDWPTAKKKISEANFLQQVKSYDKDTVPESMVKKLAKYVKNPDFSVDSVKAVSAAAGALCVWVHAINIYAGVAKEVEPKRKKLAKAEKSLATKQAALQASTDALKIVIDKVADLDKQYKDSVGEKEALREEAESLEQKLQRADDLVNGLSGEYTRWQASIAGLEQNLKDLTGDCLAAAAYLSYCGPFDSVYREELLTSWMLNIKAKEIPHTPTFEFCTFLSKPTDVREWNIQGLPKDDFSTENGVMVARGERWPLMIDPQGQANRWVKNMEGAELKVIDLKMKDFLRDVENAIQFGMPVLLQDVLEELDPSLEPVLNRSIKKVGNRLVLKLGDKELDYSKDFKFYITTKLPNPHYMPEVSTKTTLVNFSIKQDGLEQQLLGTVVHMEQPKLEEQKNELVLRVAAGLGKLVDLENLILRLLSEATGSLLDDDELVKTLQSSKTTSIEVNEQLDVAQATEIKIDEAREGYRSAAIRSAICFFALNALNRVDPMYQFSLDAYVGLFEMSIKNSRTDDVAPDDQGGRCKQVNTYHTYSVYKYVCRGLFEKHKLLFSFQMCSAIMMNEKKINMEEYEFLVYGGTVLDRADQRPNPSDGWLDAASWDNLNELEKLPAFQGLASGFDQSVRDWKEWFMRPSPESDPLPGGWESKVSELQRMCIVRSLRVDRMSFATGSFIGNNLGAEFCDPPPFDMRAIFNDSTAITPLVFVLSPGADPTVQVFNLGDDIGTRVENVALGQGQAPVATKLVDDGMIDGFWVFLANCHLMLSWMPELEKMVETYCTDATKQPHQDFRLWLSSSPHPKFPISLLQRAIKMTTEPPKGLRANMSVLFNLVTEDQFARCGQQHKYKKLLFALAWFHAVLLERRKFKSLGFNIPYEFNESDFAICHDLVIVFLDEYPENTPWDAMKYLISEANYGGRITDDWDRRLVNVYIAQFFCDNAIDIPGFPLSSLPEYYIPPDGPLGSYKDQIRCMPLTDLPAAFGQHANADISSMIEDSNEFFVTVSSLMASGAGASDDEAAARVLNLAKGLEEQTPPSWDLRAVRKSFESRSDPDPLKTVLFQELDRYNKLLKNLKRDTHALQLGVQGLVVITPKLELVSQYCQAGRVPDAWSFAYPSTKPLGPWMRDLLMRVDQMKTWIDVALPKVFWLTGFTYPTGFLTAMLQTTARKDGIAIDTLSWEFPVINQDEEHFTAGAKSGGYMKGIFLEGARWDYEKGHLVDARPMELFCPMPIIHFKPVENKKKSSKGYYSCPVYMYPIRTGTRERPSYMATADIKAGAQDSDFWTRRGTAMLLSLGM